MVEFILALGIVVLAIYLLDKRNERIESEYSTHRMEYEELHKCGAVQYFLIDHDIHARYRMHKYSTMVSIKLNTKRCANGIWVVIDDVTYHVRLTVTFKGKEQYWVMIGNLTEVSPPPLPDNVYRTRIPKHTWNKAP